jgi:hypothetical protein
MAPFSRIVLLKPSRVSVSLPLLSRAAPACFSVGMGLSFVGPQDIAGAGFFYGFSGDFLALVFKTD